MLHRVCALVLATILAALPSLNRICLTGCDLEKSTTIRADRSAAAVTTEQRNGGDKNCPLHDTQPSPPLQPAAPDRPSSPSPCQHQPELASTDYAGSRGLALDTEPFFGAMTVTNIADPILPVTDRPIANRRPTSPLRPPRISILRI